MATNAPTLDDPLPAIHGDSERRSPALTALVVYLRPAPRRLLLDAAADMGLFVVERQGAKGMLEAARLVRADLAMVVRTPGDQTETVERLADAFPRRLVLVHPAGTTAEVGLGSGIATIRDNELEQRFAEVVAPVARAARLARVRTPADTARVFGGVEFAEETSQLRCSGRAIALSRSEREVLRRLVRSLGRPVSHLELEAACAAEPEPVHPGLLKAVILRLRRKATAIGGDADLLQTIRGFGYVLAG